MLDLHQGFTGRELRLGPYVKLGIQQVNVLVRLFKGQVLEAGALQLTTVAELGRQVSGDLGETARRLMQVAEGRVLDVLKPSTRRTSSPPVVPATVAEPQPAYTRETATVMARPLEQTVPEVVATVLQERLRGGEELVFLDVREPVETLGGVIPGATLIPLDQVSARVGELRGEQRAIVIYCASGNRSKAAAMQLLGLGLTQVASLRGGIRSWASAGGDISLPPRRESA